jgi:type II secretory pathway predicted ATPase ExeA
MYKAHFGLKENPFNINTDPRYLYLTQRTQEALDCLTYGIEARKGFILLTGEVGTGKTTILNKLLDSLHQQRAATAFVFNPRMTAAQLFEYMVADFGVVCKSKARSHVLFKLHEWLLDRYQAGEQTVLVVDEAQVLSRQALEEVRLLTNLETSTHKLLQIVLAGQPEIEEKLNQRELRQLRQRIALRAKTLPLTLEETSGYILERLRIAGSNGQEIFSPLAIEAVYRHARGIPRVTNLLSEQSLARAFVHGHTVVSPEIVEEVAREFSLDEPEQPAQPQPARLRVTSRSNGNHTGRRQRVRSRRRYKTASHNGNGHAAQPPTSITQVKLPLFVYGCGPDGEPFYEHAHTIATNPNGGLISLTTPVQPGQRILITNKENEYSQECVVGFLGAHLARGVDVAFEFAAPMPEFWGPRELAKTAAGASDEACA